MVNLTVFFDTAVNGEPLGCISFKPFADKIPKTVENFCALERKDLVIRVPAFTELFQGLCVSVASSHAIMALVANPSVGRNLMTVTEWLDGKHVVFGKVKGGKNIVEAMERFGFRNGNTSKKITIADYRQF
ncbi:hypothetical protein H8959_020426 [Pygathrix nigripes]